MQSSTCFKVPSFLNPCVLSILAMEAAERFTYYGFRAVLVLYFASHLHFSDSASVSLFAYTGSLAYFTPLVGALTADMYLGLYNTILIFGVFYTVGLVLLTYAAYLREDEDHYYAKVYIFTFLGLFFICFGTGGIKPCVSIFGADQVLHKKINNEEDSSSGTEAENVLVQNFYAWFYFCINLGSVMSFLFIPIIRSTYGYGAAFLLPTIFIAVAMFCFIHRRDEYFVREISSSKTGNDISVAAPKISNNLTIDTQDEENDVPPPSLFTTFHILFILMVQKSRDIFQCEPKRTFSNLDLEERVERQLILSSNSADSNDYDESRSHSLTDLQQKRSSTEHYPDCTTATLLQNNFSPNHVADTRALLRILPVFAMIPVFWMLYDQNSSMWTLQAQRMNLHGLQPEQLGLINPVLIMLLIPLFDVILYPFAESCNINTSHLRRMCVGMFLTACSFFMSAALENVIARNVEGSINVVWMIPQYTILSISEILVSITGLEFAYSYAPTSLKASVMALYLLTVAVGDLSAGLLYTFLPTNLGQAFALNLCAVIMLLNLAFFYLFVVKRWEADLLTSTGD